MIDKYNDYLKYELNYSDYTIKEYIIHVNEFLLYCKNNDIKFICIPYTELNNISTILKSKLLI